MSPGTGKLRRRPVTIYYTLTESPVGTFRASVMLKCLGYFPRGTYNFVRYGDTPAEVKVRLTAAIHEVLDRSYASVTVEEWAE